MRLLSELLLLLVATVALVVNLIVTARLLAVCAILAVGLLLTVLTILREATVLLKLLPRDEGRCSWLERGNTGVERWSLSLGARLCVVQVHAFGLPGEFILPGIGGLISHARNVKMFNKASARTGQQKEGRRRV